MAEQGGWQSLAALAVVGVTIFLFFYRSFRKKRRPAGCDKGDCGCPGKLKKPLTGEKKR